jgi:polysaccharide export outer membrane protein
MRHLGGFSLGVCLLLSTAGCYISKNGPAFDPRAQKNVTTLTNFAQVESTNKLSPDWLKPSTNYFRLGPGDRVELEILSDTNNTRTVTMVCPDGKLYFYLLPGIDVWGLTLDEARQKIEDALSDLITKPELRRVAIQLRGIDSARVWILGRVQNAGVYPMGTPMTVLEALTAAGGAAASSASGTTEDLADLQHAFVIRNGQRLPIDFEALLQRGDMSQNIYLQPDDFIYLPSSLSKDIYVLGAVRMPKAVARQQGTLVAAIADAGGPIKNAYLDHVAIVRGSLSNPRIAVVDYQKIVHGEAPDILLEPRDIIYVPFSPYRYLTKYAELALQTFVRAVAINEGARAAVPNTAPTGIAIGVGR